MLKRRLIAVLILLPPVILMVWANKLTCTILAAGWGGVSTYEFYQMVSRTKAKPLTLFGVTCAVLFIVSPYFNRAILLPTLLTGTVVLSLISILLEKDKEDVFSRWVWTLAGAIYVGWLMSYLVALRGLSTPIAGESAGRNWIFYVLFTTFGSDTMAYCVGKTVGRHHLAPYVSPGKTWEGAVGGLMGAVLMSLFFILKTPVVVPLSLAQAIILGLAVSVAGQLGDLVKSLIKRNMGVKDSSNLIPGHGGFLDRIDSVLFAGVVVYYFVMVAV